MSETATGGERATAVLGTKETAVRLSLDLAALGCRARAVEALVIRFLPLRALDEALALIRDYTDLLLTSRPAARVFAERFRMLGLDAASLAHLRVFVVGPSTAAALEGVEGLPAPRWPARADAEALAETIGDPAGRRFLHPRAENARNVLDRRLGPALHALPVYQSVPQDLTPILDEIDAGSIAALVLCSPSIARQFLSTLGDRRLPGADNPSLVALGEPTARVLRTAGRACLVARTPEARSILEALEGGA